MVYKQSGMTKDENVRQERARSDSYGRLMVLPVVWRMGLRVGLG